MIETRFALPHRSPNPLIVPARDGCPLRRPADGATKGTLRVLVGGPGAFPTGKNELGVGFPSAGRTSFVAATMQVLQRVHIVVLDFSRYKTSVQCDLRRSGILVMVR